MRPSIKFAKEHFKDKEEIICAEIGVQHGYHAMEILDLWRQVKKIYLIDMYKEGASWAILFHALCFLMPYKDKTIWLIGDSKEVINYLPDNRFDFIYIDADHSEEGCRSDIIKSYPKVIHNGILCGHDFGDSRVQKAVQDFANANNLKLFSDSGDWWFIKNG
jgi:predicted O-methyltransferase YrrM